VLHFEWDAAKNERNIRIHGIDFADAAPIFDAPMFTWADTRKAYGEARTVGLGPDWSRDGLRFHGAWPGSRSLDLSEKGQ
jgi:uncharacterized DUF497 family protein